MEERTKIKKYLKKRELPYSEKDIDEFLDGFDIRKKIALEIAKTDISEEEYNKLFIFKSNQKVI